MEHLYIIFQNIWNRIGNVKPSDSARYRGRGVIWIFPILITALFFISISHAEVKAKEEVNKNDAAKSQAQVTYGNLPLYFIQNDGQLDGKVKFYEKGSGHATYFTKEGVYVSLVSGKQAAGSNGDGSRVIARDEVPKQSLKPDANVAADFSLRSLLPSPLMGKPSPIPSPLAGEGQGGGAVSDLIHLTFIDANPNPEIITEGLQEGKVNYFIGNDQKKWRTNIPTYQAVLYKEVYPGIDIKFYGNNHQLEYDIIVKPGADPSKVQFAYEGVEDLRIAENGDLEIILHPSSPFAGEGRGEGNKIIQRKPVIYQEIDGKRVEVEGKFKVHSNNIITSEAFMSQQLTTKEQNIPPLQGEGQGVDGLSSSEAKQPPIPSPLAGEGKGEGDSGSGYSQFAYTFEVASYDKNHPIIIDPTLVYSTYIGGSLSDDSVDIAVDGSGNAYVAGRTGNIDFPVTTGVYDTTQQFSVSGLSGTQASGQTKPMKGLMAGGMS